MVNRKGLTSEKDSRFCRFGGKPSVNSDSSSRQNSPRLPRKAELIYGAEKDQIIEEKHGSNRRIEKEMGGKGEKRRILNIGDVAAMTQRCRLENRRERWAWDVKKNKRSHSINNSVQDLPFLF